MQNRQSLSIRELHERYRSGRQAPADVMRQLVDAAAGDPRHLWIRRLTLEEVMTYVRALEGRSIDDLPLYGIPFVIKDNIDLAGVATTAGCPDFAFTPDESATVVAKLIAAGAIPLGKTNLDQFATGLVGTRSPYGACRNAFDVDFISGGSSAGSAVAVAAGVASFALGTDTAGSGRVPAAFNNLIGLKPSNGRLSTRGVVPACRSLDNVSIFALTAEDAAAVLAVAQGVDAADPYSRRIADRPLAGLRYGVPRSDQLKFFGDTDYERLFDVALRQLDNLGGTRVEIDLAPFLEVARLLYEGPWIAERQAAVGAFLDTHPASVLPVTRHIIEAGKRFSATDAYAGMYRLKALARVTEALWEHLDLIVTPTAGTIYRITDVDADPIRLNANLGYYTNFVNLLDLCAVAVPAGFRSDGLPFGITLIGLPGTERALLKLAEPLQRGLTETAGATGYPLAPVSAPGAPALGEGYMALAVCGAHMDGLPLNPQLRAHGAYLLSATRTAARYRLFALPGGPPSRPGLVRVATDGVAIELEVWAIPSAELGAFAARIPAPLGLANLELESGRSVFGFVCESYASAGATDISRHGGWRGYLDAGVA